MAHTHIWHLTLRVRGHQVRRKGMGFIRRGAGRFPRRHQGQIGAVMQALKKSGIAANKFYVAKEREPCIHKPEAEHIKSDSALQSSIEFRGVSFALVPV